MNTALWWIRRDLRLSDNQALDSALQQAAVVIPVFILDPALLASPYNSSKRLAFLLEGLRTLESDLRSRGSRLIVRQGDPQQELHILCMESGATAIFAEADVSPYARRRDARIQQSLPLTLTPGLTVHPPQSLHKVDGAPYTVFTPFSRFWRSRPFPPPPLPAPQRLPSVPDLVSLPVPVAPAHPADSPFPAGEAEAQRRLAAFAESSIWGYAEGRNRMDWDGASGGKIGGTSGGTSRGTSRGTSLLSPYLRFGMLSARQAAWAAQRSAESAGSAEARQGASTWLNELIWREFYITILYYFPQARRAAFRPAFRCMNWLDDAQGFAAWAEGRTGYPVVDAAMRQLQQTGWMHNRARMIAASFLCKDLLLDWRLGERHFMQHLLDGDPAANNGGWQWVAGSGTDAAPYYRIFNPSLQAQKFDPQGAYVRRWLPELAGVPAALIHTPWQMPLEVQHKAGCLIGRDYPSPIVDHAFARQRALAAYQNLSHPPS